MSSNVKVAVAQLNCTVGDFEGNSRKILDAARRAAGAGARVLLTPELSLTGYPPEDLLLRRAFYAATDTALQKLCAQLLQFPEMKVVVGHPLAREGRRFNAASVIADGMVIGTYCKHDLPNYDVFDEQRYFTPDNRPFVFEVDGTAFGINICEDTWFPYAPECSRAAGADVLLVLNASPFHLGKHQQRLQIMRTNVCKFGMPAVYANLVGRAGRTRLRRRFVRARRGGTSSPARRTSRRRCCSSTSWTRAADRRIGALEPAHEALVYSALVLGVRDYIGKNGFPGVLLGLSGGIDSALTLAVAVDALGRGQSACGDDAVALYRAASARTTRARWRNLGVRYDDWTSCRPSTRSRTRWRRSSRDWPPTPPKRTCRRASAARC